MDRSDQALESELQELYLDLLKRVLTRAGFEDPYRPLGEYRTGVLGSAIRFCRQVLRKGHIDIVRVEEQDPAALKDGRAWMPMAETMVGLRRLDNLQECVTDVVRRRVPGDLLEAGVWRGGATILMRAILKAYGDSTRRVWVADSFQGLPPPDEDEYPADAGDRHHQAAHLRVSLEDVKANFARYGLLDERVCFLPGWFRDTLPTAPVDRLAVLRLDGDMYESTVVALRALYQKVSPGGYVIIDDYGAVEGCRAAVEDFRREQGITDQLVEIDWGGRFWQRSQ